MNKRAANRHGPWIALAAIALLWGLWELAAALLFDADVVEQLLAPGGAAGSVLVAAAFMAGRLGLIFVGGPVAVALIVRGTLNALTPDDTSSPRSA